MLVSNYATDATNDFKYKKCHTVADGKRVILNTVCDQGVFGILYILIISSHISNPVCSVTPVVFKHASE